MASVFIGDLDDIIGPSQACVNPIFAGKSTTLQQNGAPAEPADKGKAKLTLEASWMEADDNGTNVRPDLIKTQGSGSAATVSLNDCLACRYAPCPLPLLQTLLFSPPRTAICPWHIYVQYKDSFFNGVLLTYAAHRPNISSSPTYLASRLFHSSQSTCSTSPLPPPLPLYPPLIRTSGCVTSAETVLISQQSGEEFLRVLSGSSHALTRAVVLALSPQALASLAVRLGCSSKDLQRGLSLFFKALACKATAPHREPLPVYVYNTTAAAPIAIAEATAEFVARYRYTQQQQLQQQSLPLPPMWQSPAPSRALSSTRDAPPLTSATTALEAATGYLSLPPSLSHTRLPMLASECPGWVCYAEKTTPQALPYLSTVKSPQQVLGTLVKAVLAPREGLKAGEVCLVGVMPCYDKKLEASRADFVHEEWEGVEGGREAGVPEVDLVLTAGEVLEMLRAFGKQQQQQQAMGVHEGGRTNEYEVKKEEEEEDVGLAVVRALFFSSRVEEEGGGEEGGIATMEVENCGRNCSSGKGSVGTIAEGVRVAAGPTARPLTLQSAEEHLFKSGSLLPYSSTSTNSTSSSCSHLPEIGSGGYLEHIFRGAARELFGVDVGPGPLQYQEGRNRDYKEVVLEVGGEQVLRFALAYGFRNIQGVMGKMRRGKCSVQYVEIMACPSGCVNGGGMVKGGQGEGPAVGKERVGKVWGRLWEDQENRRREEEEEKGGREGAALVRWAYGEVAREGVGGETALRLFHTRYHAVPKLEQANPSVIKW